MLGFDLLTGFFDGLRPIVRLTVDEWSDENVRLTSENSAEPGRYRTDRFPFLRDIFRDLSPTSTIVDVTFMKGVQLGVTTAALNVAGCFIDIDPCPIMFVYPTISLAESVSKDRFTPMVENSPALSKKIRPVRERDSGNTVLSKAFRGGRVYFSGANSAASLRSRPVRILLADELDAFPLDADGEGSPLSLAEKRQSTFAGKRKTFKLSTPTIKGQSRIELEIEETDYRKYFLPCPHCGSMQHLEFDNIRWTEGNPDNAWYECAHCHEAIEEHNKPFMLANGVWQPTRPEKVHPLRKGYHLNSLYSPLGMLSWGEIVNQYLKALKDDTNTLMKAFVNSILGESFEVPGDSPEWERLHDRCSDYQVNTVPESDIAFLTAGVDVQRDRIEVEIVGWRQGRVSYSIDYRVLEGDTSASSNPVWGKLSAILNEQWSRPDGAEMPLRMMAVDSGYNQSTVYEFCQSHDASRVIPIKGDDNMNMIVGTPKSVHVNQAGKRIGAVRLWTVGSSLLKSELYGYLKLNLREDGSVPDGYCYFPQYDAYYFKMLTAEKLQLVKDKKGFYKQMWVLPSHARNEALDCRNYARAAAAVCNMDRWTPEDWASVSNSYGVAAPVVQKPKRRRGGGFLDSGSFWDR